MIRIQSYPSPPHYEQRVRQRGLRYLARNPRPTSSDFSRHNYWREIHDDLYNLHSGICAYCALWTPRTPGGKNNTSVDHFIPKTTEPRLAYEWENFRMCRARLNAKKGVSLEVMDPLYIEDGWFTIDFTTFLIRPLRTAPAFVQTHVTATVDCLCLNDNDYVYERIEIIKEYSRDLMTLDQLRSKYPFVAAEIVRQNFDQQFKVQMRNFFTRGHA